MAPAEALALHYSSVPDAVLAMPAHLPAEKPDIGRQAKQAWSLPRLTALDGLLVPALLLVSWEMLARFALIDARILPPPTVVAATIGKLAASGELEVHVAATLARIGAGYAAGITAGVMLGALTGYFAALNRLLDPLLQGLRNVPSIAWVPLFILWFGIFETSKVLLIAVGAFFPVYLGLSAGIRDIDRKLVEVGRVYGYSAMAMIGRILLPASLPALGTGLRSGLGLAWMFVVAAEMMGASEGLGFLLLDGQMTGRPAVIVAAILLFAILGKTSDALLAHLLRRLSGWQDSFVPSR